MKRLVNESLVCHPAQPPAVALSIRTLLEVMEDRSGRLVFSVDTPSGFLQLPEPSTPRFADDLWRHTCGELFVAVANEPAYREYNFSPSGQWACYEFSDYRVIADKPCGNFVPEISGVGADGRQVLQVELPAGSLPDSKRLQISLSMVIEDVAGGLSYWALHHPAERPDFHHRGGFKMIDLEAVEVVCEQG